MTPASWLLCNLRQGSFFALNTGFVEKNIPAAYKLLDKLINIIIHILF